MPGATTSKLVLALNPTDGIEEYVQVDAFIFGCGDLASRPATGDAAGDMYVVLDTGLGIYRFDIWDGTQWQPMGNASGLPVPTEQGQVLYAREASAFTVELPLTSPEGWLVNDQGLLLVV